MATAATIRRREEKAAYYRANASKYYEREKKYVKDNPEFRMWWAAKRRAKTRGLPFNLERTDIVIPEACPILGLRLETGEGVSTDASPTLDRIDPSLGYVRGNVWVISALANRMKSNANAEQLRAFAEWILRDQSK